MAVTTSSIGQMPPRVPDAEIIFRRIPVYASMDFVTVDKISGKTRPSSGAFKTDADGVSVYLRGVLEEHDLNPRDLIRTPQNAVVELPCEVPRNDSLDVLGDPWPPGSDDPTHKRNAAHALIAGLQPLSSKKRRKIQARMAQKSVWTILPVSQT